MNNPTVSIIMTVYNRQRYLTTAIESVLAQDFGNLELIIWDDGSTDESIVIAAEHAAIDARIRLEAASHQGRGAALDSACNLAKGKYIGFVDSDDAIAPDTLFETLPMLVSNPDVGVVYTDQWLIDASGAILRYSNKSFGSYSPHRMLTEFMTHHFRLIRRSVFEEVGGVDSWFKFNQDYDLCLRLSEVTQFLHLKKPLYYYRCHEDRISVVHRKEQLRYALVAANNALARRCLAEIFVVEADENFRFHLREKQPRSQPRSL